MTRQGVPNEVRRRRRALDLTQADLAKLVGINRATLCIIERGGDTRLTTAMSLARHLGTDVETLFPTHAANAEKDRT